MTGSLRRAGAALLLALVLSPLAATASAQGAPRMPIAPEPGATEEGEPVPDPASPSIIISMPGTSERGTSSYALRIILVLTVLSVAPGLLLALTSFTRIVIVLSFVRQALGTQSAPPTQVVLALSLLLTFVVMAPIFGRIHTNALGPWMDEEMEDEEAFSIASEEISTFLLRQTREDDLLLFYELSHAERPESAEDVSLHLLVPAFMISELRTGFEMGFLLFLPFLLVDLVVASLLTSMGMVMMPPTMVSTPLKILLFVLVDGWALLTRSLVASFG